MGKDANETKRKQGLVNRPGRANSRSNAFIALRPTDDERDEISRLSEDADRIRNALQEIAEAGFKVTVQWEDRNSCVAVYCTPAWLKFSERSVLVARHTDAYKALAQIIHAVTGKYAEADNWASNLNPAEYDW